MTRYFYNLNLLEKLRNVLLHQVLLNVAITTIAEAILMWLSAEQVASLHRIALVVNSALNPHRSFRC